MRKPDGTRLDYSYDVFGRRVSKTRSGGPLDGKRVEYVWDGEVLAWELDSEKGPRTFVHEPGGFEPILQQQGGETYLCVNDHLGMPKELIDGGGNLAWAAAHGAYGAVIATEGPGEVAVEGGFVSGGEPRVESPFRLLGQVHDEDAELSCTRFRCFDADTGTWISTDPLEIAGGAHLYALDGAPSRVSDPLGLTVKKQGHSHEELPDDALVVRGGTCTAETFKNGSGVTEGADGKLSGISTQSKAGSTVDTLAQPVMNNQVGVTTVGQIRAAGGTVTADGTPDNPNHATVSGLSAEQAEELFKPQPNPVPKAQRGRRR